MAVMTIEAYYARLKAFVCIDSSVTSIRNATSDRTDAGVEGNRDNSELSSSSSLSLSSLQRHPGHIDTRPRPLAFERLNIARSDRMDREA